MAAPHPVTLDTPIVIKIAVNGQLKKLKLPMKDLGVTVLPDKVCDKLDAVGLDMHQAPPTAPPLHSHHLPILDITLRESGNNTMY
jgi:hypothetical protein